MGGGVGGVGVWVCCCLCFLMEKFIVSSSKGVDTV